VQGLNGLQGALNRVNSVARRRRHDIASPAPDRDQVTYVVAHSRSAPSRPNSPKSAWGHFSRSLSPLSVSQSVFPMLRLGIGYKLPSSDRSCSFLSPLLLSRSEPKYPPSRTRTHLMEVALSCLFQGIQQQGPPMVDQGQGYGTPSHGPMGPGPGGFAGGPPGAQRFGR
jgi:hypothetical protein